MPPKKKAKKPKKPKEPTIDEPVIDASFYNAQITELNLILSALRSKQEELRNRNEEIINAEETLVRDEADILLYLNRTIQERTDDQIRMQTEYENVEKERALKNEEFEDKKQCNMDIYRQTEEQLISDMKLTSGKMHALEEFRVQRDELMKKYEIMENALEEQKIRHKREIYEVERKFIIGKDKLKKEMDAKLKWLIDEFQSVTDVRVAATTLRVIRENIALNNQLDVVLRELRKLYERHEKLAFKDNKMKLLTQLHSYEATVEVGKARKLNATIVRLSNEYYDMKKAVRAAGSLGPVLQNFVKMREEQDSSITEGIEMKRILEQNLHEYRCQREDVAAETRYVDQRNNSLIDMLLKAKDMIQLHSASADAYTLLNTPESEWGSETNSKSTMLYKLYDFLNQMRTWYRSTCLIEKLECRDDIYMKGRLGLVPRDVTVKTMVTPLLTKGEQTEGTYSDILEEQLASESLAEEIEMELEEFDSVEGISVTLVEQETQTDEELMSASTSSTSSTLIGSQYVDDLEDDKSKH